MKLVEILKGISQPIAGFKASDLQVGKVVCTYEGLVIVEGTLGSELPHS